MTQIVIIKSPYKKVVYYKIDTFFVFQNFAQVVKMLWANFLISGCQMLTFCVFSENKHFKISGRYFHIFYRNPKNCHWAFTCYYIRWCKYKKISNFSYNFQIAKFWMVKFFNFTLESMNWMNVTISMNVLFPIPATC